MSRPKAWLRWGLSLAFAVWAAAAAAENGEREAMPMTLEECVRLAVSNNLPLRQKRLAAREALAGVSAARGAFDPALEAAFSHAETRGDTAEGTDSEETESEAWSAGVGGATPFFGLRYDLGAEMSSSSGSAADGDDVDGFLGLTLTQPLLKGLATDANRYAARTAVLEAERALLQLDQQAQESLFSLENAWIDLIAARETVVVREEAVRLAERLRADNERKVAIGTMARLDERQAASQAASARASLAAARQAETAAQNALKALVFASQRETGRLEIVPPEAALPSEEGEVDEAAAFDTALERRPDVRLARIAEDLQRETARKARSDRLPQLDLSGRYGLAARDEDGYGDAWEGMTGGDRTEWRVGVEFSFPLGNRAARNALRSAELAGERLALARAETEEAALVEVADAVRGIAAAEEACEAAEEAVAYAAEALDAGERKLAEGKETSFVVLQLQKELTDAKKDLIDAAAAHWRERAAFAKAQGLTLDRLGVTAPSEAER